MRRVVLFCLLALLSCLLTLTASSQISGYVDVANDGNGHTTIAYPSGNLVVAGWAGDSGFTAPVAQIQVLIDGVPVGNATPGVARPDVAAAFPSQSWQNSGWTFTYAVKNIAAGTHTVSAIAIDNNVSQPLGPSSGSCCSITVIEPDLTEPSVTTSGTPAAGASLQVTDTTYNAGSGPAGISWTRLYLNTTAVKTGGTLLATRSISTLASLATSTVTTMVTLPTNIAGNYFLVACADDTSAVMESNETNNCGSAAITVAAADLAESVAAPNAVLAGQNIVVADTTSNLGTVAAGASWTRVYLNKSATKGGALVLTRSLASLNSGASSAASNTINVPSTYSGQYYVIACANDTSSVKETNLTNNCAVSALQVFTRATTIVVDKNGAGALNSATCGMTNYPACLSIGQGITNAQANQLVWVNPGGTYSEQVVINKSISVASTGTTVNPASIVPPTTLSAVTPANGDPYTTLVSIGASNVVFTGITVKGPGPSGCGSLTYGVFAGTGTNVTVSDNQVLSIRDNPASGCQNGTGIAYGWYQYPAHATGTISNNVVLDYQKRGILVDGSGSNAIISGNTVIGLNTTGIIGQNGIQISRGATGSVGSNVVSNNRYGTDACSSSADGILVYATHAGAINVSGNTLFGNDEGIGIYGDSYHFVDGLGSQFVTVQGNTVFNNRAFGGIHIDAISSNNNVWLNTVYGNTVYDEADETGSWTSPNNWGTDPSNYNHLGNGGTFTLQLGPVSCGP